jgi:hypothetical protein
MKNVFFDIASQFGKAFAQELMKTNQEQVKLVPSQPTVEIPFLDEEKAITELPVSDPFTEEDYLRFIERFPKYKNSSLEEIRGLKELNLRSNKIIDISSEDLAVVAASPATRPSLPFHKFLSYSFNMVLPCFWSFN